MIHFGDKFLMLLHKAEINTRLEFVDRCIADSVYTRRKTAGTYFDRWKGRATPPTGKLVGDPPKDDPMMSVEKMCEFMGVWTRKSAADVSSLVTDDLSVGEFVKRLGINFNKVRDRVTQPTRDQWDELQGVDPYSRMQFLQAVRQLMNHRDPVERKGAQRKLESIIGRYYLYRRHSDKEGVLRELIHIVGTYDCFAEGVYYQWDPDPQAPPREIKFNAFFGGTHVACLAGKTYKSNTRIELTSVQFLFTEHEIMRRSRMSKKSQRYHFFAGMLSGTFDQLDALMATRALLMYRAGEGLTRDKHLGECVRMLDRGHPEHDAFEKYLSLETDATT